MNKLLLSRFFRAVNFTILLFFIYPLVCQELPPIQNFSTQDYLAGNQNWSIVQAENKYIYVANNEGLLEYNGASWKTYPSPNQTAIRSVNIINDRLYSGSFREFGYWERNEHGTLDYYSLSSSIIDQLGQDEHIWKIFSFDHWVVFQSLQAIYFYDTVNHSFKIVQSETKITKAFSVEKDIYFQRSDRGIYKIENGIARLFSDDPVLKENNIIHMFSRDGSLFFQTSDNGFYTLKNNKLEHWDIPADKQLQNLSVFSSIQLKDESFVLGTISKGLFHLDKYGKIIGRFSRSNGLQNNTVLSVYQDFDQNIWLGLDNGISLINLNSPYTIFNDTDGSLGTVYSSALYNGLLYIGTNQGLFAKSFSSDETYQSIPGTEGQVWCLKIIHGDLFCGHNNGTYQIDGKNAKLISDVDGTWDVKAIKGFSTMLIQGNYDGLNLLEKRNGKWQFLKKVDGFDISSRHFEMMDNNIVFVNHEYKGIYKLQLTEDFKKVSTYSLVKSVPKGLKSDLLKYKNELYYSSDLGIFKYHDRANIFIKDSIFTNQFLGDDQYVSGTLILDSTDQSIWGFTQEHIINLRPGKLTNEVNRIKFPFPNPSRGTVSGYENMTKLKKNEYLIGTSSGYTILHTDKLEEEKNDFYVNIASIKNSVLDQEKVFVSFFRTQPFDNKENNIYFEFGVTAFDKIYPIQYQHKLEGLYDEWSEWTKKSEISYTNLPGGNYTFKLRAKQGNYLSKNNASFSFTIAEPWYLSSNMYLLYVIFIILLIFLINLLNRWHFKKQKERSIEEEKRVMLLRQLNNEKEIVQLRNEKLQSEVESKSNELINSTSNVIKLNEILTSIKSDLEPVNDQPVIKKVIKMINQRLNKNSDWETFQEAFNHTDREFLNKLKNAHPSLTPHDLRLCTYLRLNLTSKEIAPLLNISPRSVEIKRYRLRKKMNLEHESGLVEYILSI